jgi:GT2 family glycosyltransferase
VKETRVAVVIPCHDAAATLAETLQSVRAQTLPAAQVVVVDDGSRDASAEIARRAGVRCVQQECRGPGAARSRGIAETTAPLVAFLDADDCFLPEKLERQVAHLHEHGLALSCCDAWLLRDGARGPRKNGGRGVPARISFDELLRRNPIICSSVVARRDALVEAGGFDEDPVLIATEDYDLWLRIARIGALGYLDEPLLCYRVSAGSLSDDRRFLRGLDRIMAKVTALDASPEVARAAARRRAGVRVDAAYHLARRGEGREARALLREARALAGGSRAQAKIWLRSWWPR